VQDEELEAMKAKLADMEKEQAKIQEMQVSLKFHVYTMLL